MAGSSAEDPANLDVLYRAFSAAWREVRAKQLGKAETIRARLASVILDAGENRDLDEGQLRDIAITSVCEVPTEGEWVGV